MSGDETLLDIAVRNLKAAKILYTYKTDDEAFLNQVGFHLQQCVELALKHDLEIHAIEYPRTHDIDDLLALLPDSENFDYVESFAANITSLEAKTRYIKNYRVSRRIIDSVMKIAERLVRELQGEGKERLKGAGNDGEEKPEKENV